VLNESSQSMEDDSAPRLAKRAIAGSEEAPGGVSQTAFAGFEIGAAVYAWFTPGLRLIYA
jgi:hypothetical protein